MIKLLITRHGETKENIDGTIQGKEHGNINEKGYQQILKLVERLKKEKIDLIISSDIPRCVLTTKEILKKNNIPVVYSKLVREKNNGDWVGKKHEEIEWNSLGGDFENRKPPNGESLVEVRERARKFFRDLLKYKDKTILIISHGAFLKVFVGDLLGMSLHDSIFKLKIDHCSLTEIDIEKGYKEGYQVTTLNEKTHLE